MMTFTVRSHVGKDGILNLQVPTEIRDSDVEIVVVIQPQKVGKQVQESGYPQFFFEETFGSLPELQEVESEGSYELREELA